MIFLSFSFSLPHFISFPAPRRGRKLKLYLDNSLKYQGFAVDLGQFWVLSLHWHSVNSIKLHFKASIELLIVHRGHARFLHINSDFIGWHLVTRYDGFGLVRFEVWFLMESPQKKPAIQPWNQISINYFIAAAAHFCFFAFPLSWQWWSESMSRPLVLLQLANCIHECE